MGGLVARKDARIAARRRGKAARDLYISARRSTYKPNGKTEEVIGLISGLLTHITTDSVPGTLTQTIFDTTSRADSAQILLTNSTGGTRTVVAAWIRGKAVTRLSGDEGYIHDKFVDYEMQAKDGDIVYETGNNFVVTADQVNRLADYHWKLNRTKKHIYTLSLVGFQTWYEPGEWYTLQIGGAGEAEYIDSTVECFDVRCSIAAGRAGYTSVSFREVEESWKFDSNETARMIASGQFNRRPSQSVVTVAAQYYSGYADYYCDGTADQSEINDAITYLGQAGSGTVHLTKGNYNTTSSITMLDSIRLEGEGDATQIIKNCNDYAIAAIGTSTTSVTNVTLAALKVTRASADTNVVPLVYYNYADNASFDNMTVDDSYDNGIDMVNCDGGIVGPNVKILDAAETGLKLFGSTLIIASTMAVSGCKIGYDSCGYGTDKIDRGDCESATPAMVAGEITSYTSITLRDNTYAHEGTYSLKVSCQNGVLTGHYFTDGVLTNDMHGLTAGKTYHMQWYSLTEASSSTEYPSLVFMEYYSSAWNETNYIYTGFKDEQWYQNDYIITINASTSGFYFYMNEGNLITKETGYVWIDDVKMWEYDESNSGCQLTNSNIHDNDQTGILIESSHTIIQNNQVTNNASSGIVINAGYRNTVTGNRCYNNGSDTGLANTSGDNFYDAGIDTQWAG